MKFKTITIHQKWSDAYEDWFATTEEKRSFKEQLLSIHSQKVNLNNRRSVDSYFSQLKKNKLPISTEAENYANQFFGLNRKNL